MRVSVVIAAYNARATIGESIASARVIADEIIVVDDGSTDGTGALAESMGATVLRQDNAGASLARARGLRGSAGDYVIFLDADDELASEGVQRSIDLLDSELEVAVAAGRIRMVLPDGTIQESATSYSDVNATALLQKGFGPWPPAAQVVRRAALSKSAELEIPELRPLFAEDYEMLIRLSLTGPIRHHELVSAQYRAYFGKSALHPRAALESKESIRSHYAQALGIKVDLFSGSELRFATHTRRARVFAARGQRLRAAASVLLAIGTSPHIAVKRSIGRRKK